MELMNAEKVRELREGCGMSQAAFAAALGKKSGKTIQNWEGGSVITETDQLLLSAVAAACGHSFDTMEGWARDMRQRMGIGA